MTRSTEKKWNSIYQQRSVADASPCRMLKDYSYFLPTSGDALDLACGLGGNAIFLARSGLNTLAWDISEQAVSQLNQYARENALPLRASQRNVEQSPPEPDSLDVLVVSNYLYRDHLPQLMSSLRKGGVIIYQTHTVERPDGLAGPSNPQFLLQPNELLSAFSSLHVLAFHDDSLVGSLEKGFRGSAGIVAVCL